MSTFCFAVDPIRIISKPLKDGNFLYFLWVPYTQVKSYLLSLNHSKGKTSKPNVDGYVSIAGFASETTSFDHKKVETKTVVVCDGKSIFTDEPLKQFQVETNKVTLINGKILLFINDETCKNFENLVPIHHSKEGSFLEISAQDGLTHSPGTKVIDHVNGMIFSAKDVNV